MTNKQSFLRVQRRSNAGWQSNLAKRRQWFSDESTDLEDPEGSETEEKGEEVITLSKSAFNDRLKRARNKARQDTLTEFGIDENNPKSNDLDKVDELQKQLETLTQQLADLEAAQVDAETQQLKTRQLEMMRQALSQAGVRDTEDILPMLDAESMKGEDGSIDEAKLKSSIDTLRKQKSYLFNITPGSPSNYPAGAKKTDAEGLASNVKRVINF